MRTTVTLEPDVAALVQRAMEQRALGFKRVVNEAIRRGLAPPPDAAPYRLPAFPMGEPLVPLEKALQLAAELEDEERRHKFALRK